MPNRPYSLVVYQGEGDNAYPHSVGVFWKSDREDSKIVGTIELYMFPGLQIRVFPPRDREERPRERTEKQRKPEW